ncbi:MAG: hypothetical protein JST67_06510 [Bacteroidetes bacterium]|nr:hypothetical protein [Bacteroidota bacterium]
MNTVIHSYTRLKNEGLWHNKNLCAAASENKELVKTLDELYKEMVLEYPKFYKMDSLCKAGILCAEPLLKNTDTNPSFDKQKIALVFSNKNASLQTDCAYEHTRNTFPSPSLFVYTLPNIVIGEVAIKHKITGENIFFIEPSFNAQLLYHYAEILLQENDLVLCAWLHITDNALDGFFYTVMKEPIDTEKKSTFIQHKAENIHKLYMQ